MLIVVSTGFLQKRKVCEPLGFKVTTPSTIGSRRRPAEGDLGPTAPTNGFRV